MNSIAGLFFYLCVGALGGFCGSKLKIPAGTLVGAMLAVILTKMVLKSYWEMPKEFTFVIQILLGVMVGATYNPSIIKTLGKIALPVVSSTIVLIVAGIILSLIFTKLGLLDIGTAYLGTSPGAMSALIPLAFDSQADATLIVCFHFFRVVFIVLTAPLIFKIFSG
ncbi:MAG: AbrB family transcriptional regulator [Desulfobacterales bacterium]|nr:MAG: AbrB family transcriptional regulator [Desulfobacterales bacterium]UCD90616.1 MAG: AbrB family transcriptional regulator [Desulfobacterales bacterium]